MLVVINTPSGKTKLEVHPSETIDNLRALILQTEDNSPNEQHLQSDGRKMEGFNSLSHYMQPLQHTITLDLVGSDDSTEVRETKGGHLHYWRNEILLVNG